MFDILMDPYNYPFWVIVISVIAVAIALISRPFSSYMKFVYPNAKYETIGNPYIKEKELNALIQTVNLDDFKENLNSSKDYDIEGDNPDQVQKSLDNNFKKTVQMMKEDSSKKMNQFFDVYLEKNDFYLIKKELKNKLVNNVVKDESIENVMFKHNKKLLSKIKKTEKDKISELLKSYGFPPEITTQLSKEEIDYLTLDSIIDKFFLNKLLKIKVPYKCDRGKNEFIKRFIDINNIKNALRTKQMGYEKEEIMKLFMGEGLEIAKWQFEELADSDSVSQAVSSLEGTSYYNGLKDSIEKYNDQQSVQIFENALDRSYLKHVKAISQNYYISIGPTIRFLLSKEFEIKNLKLISKGISEKLESSLIKDMIVMEATS